MTELLQLQDPIKAVVDKGNRGYTRTTFRYTSERIDMYVEWQPRTRTNQGTFYVTTLDPRTKRETRMILSELNARVLQEGLTYIFLDE